MADNKFNFTDNRLRQLQPPEGKKRSYYYDQKTPGLRLQLTTACTKTFQFQARYPKKRRPPATLVLGKYPALSINEARNKSTQLMADVKAGVDIEREAHKNRDESSLDNIFELWVEQFAKPHKRSWKEDVRRYALYINKPLGNKKLSWFTSESIRNWHRKITKLPKQRGRGTITPSTANRSLALLSTIFNQMLPEHQNPCRGVKKFNEESRDRFLQPEELKRFFEALSRPATPKLLQEYVLISLYTGGRRANVLSMQWKEISFDRLVWTIPAAKSKNATAMDIPLVEEAMQILEQRKKNTKSVFVFPGTGKTGHYSEPKRAWKTLLNNAKLENVRLHDLRRTMGSWQTMTGASSTIVGKTLGHRSPEATAVYARLNLDPVRASMETAVKSMLATQTLPNKVINILKE